MTQDINELLYSSRLDVHKEIEKPPTIFYIRQRSGTTTIDVPVFSKGDLSLLQGAQKTKKTWLLSAIAASLLNEYSYIDHFNTELSKEARIAYFDTEQSDYYAQQTNKRILKISGQENYEYFALRKFNPIERRSIIEHYLKITPQCEFIFIDGIVDLLFDFNDLRECTDVVQWIMSITKQHQVHCLNVLHENFSDKKARGHIGSILAQKAESVLRIEKSKSDENTSTVSAKDTRGMHFAPFDLSIDRQNKIPIISKTELSETPW